MKTEPQLREIAADLYDGKIFTDRHLRRKEDLPFVFMVFSLGAASVLSDESLKDIGLVYEYVSEAGDRCLNGQPIFMSAKILTKAETDQMLEYLKEYKEMKEGFINKEKQKNHE